MPSEPIPFVQVATPQGEGGVLRVDGEEYLYQCAAGAAPETGISLTMPLRAKAYARRSLFPIFEMNLPEGYVLEQLRRRFAKAGRLDPMLLLALTGNRAPIGRVTVRSPSLSLAADDAGVKLADVLAWDGAENLFRELAARYLTRTGLSGMQPKVLVPEDRADLPGGKALLTTPDLIVKSAGDEYPGLAVNEFVCMSIARAAGVPVPEFFLSANRQLFVVRRFDRTPRGAPLGFEDMACLMGKPSAAKYDASYRQIALAIDLFCAPEHKAAAKAQLFDQVALSVMLGNGDAHLKNFGLLYTHPLAADARMAPAYDLVNTTRYLPDDTLALSLHGGKGLVAARLDVADFGTLCGVADPAGRARSLIDAAEGVFSAQRDLLDQDPPLRDALRHGVDLFARVFG